MSRLTQDGTVEPVSRDQTLRRERGQRNIHFPCSGDHEQDWQPYPVGTYVKKGRVARVNRRLRRYYLIVRLLPNVFALACLSSSSI